MIALEILRESLRSMRLNPLRTLLTLLGMVIGVAAVVLMLAIGQGAQATVKSAIESMGSNLFIVLSGATTSGGLRSGIGTAPTLTHGDAKAIGELPSVKSSAAVHSGSAQLAYAAANWSTLINGVTANYFDVRSWRTESGRTFDEAEVRSSARVVVLGQTVVRNLFGDEDPVGKSMRVKGSPFLVIGVLEAKGQSLDGRDQDDAAIVPITTAQTQLFGNPFPGTVRFIMVEAAHPSMMKQAERDMNDLLRARHRIPEKGDNDFTVRDLSTAAQSAAATAEAMSLMLGAIASISLLVGGIGIMNIMLVSVTERTREIGIRMALGARRSDIRLQFLLEALTICVLGGAFGAALGVMLAWLLSTTADMVVVVTVISIAIAFVFSAVVGIFFGYYPASKAARLRPVEALRFE